MYGIRPHPCKGSRVKSHSNATSREEISATRFLEHIRPSNTTESKCDEPHFSFNLLPDNRQYPTCSRPLCRSLSPDSGLCYSRCFSKLSLIRKPDMSLHCPWSSSKSGNGFVQRLAVTQALGLFALKFAFITKLKLNLSSTATFLFPPSASLTQQKPSLS